MKFIFNYFIFPGFLFTLFCGGIIFWLERKISARFQYRIGPPWYQNFLDILKLFLKETLIPQQASKVIFLLSPIISFSSALLASVVINNVVFFKNGFSFDIIVILYLLIIPSIFLVAGGLSSGNPLATAGAIREVKLMLSYEFIFIVSLLIVIIKCGSISLKRIIEVQAQFGSHIKSISGLIAFLLSLFYLQAKLGIVPFDVSEAEQEIMGGPLIEYGGPLLGFFKMTKLLLYFSLPLFVISLFLGARLGWHLLYKYLILVLILFVVKNINPRLRIKDILKVFWVYLFPLGILGIILAIIGL